MKKGFLTSLLLFGMFFGAGNLIFPPLLGFQSGEFFGPAMWGFILSGVGIAVVTLILGTLDNQGFSNMISRYISPAFSTVYLVALYLAIGPFFAIPRTAAVSYQVGVLPIVGSSPVWSMIYTIVYFVCAYVIAIRPTKLLDYIGKLLTPIFAGLILILVILGIMKYANHASHVATTAYQTNPFGEGILAGYNTLDALAAVAFCVVGIQAFKQMGFSSKQEYFKTISLVGVFTTIGFSVLYVGLGYLGNKFPVPEAILANKDSNIGAYILSESAHQIFGEFGRWFLAVLVILTCFTTTVGLISATASYFAQRFAKLSYTFYATAVTIIGFGIANIGLNMIIQYSIPVLMILYPITIALTILFVLQRVIPLSRVGMQLAVATATIMGILMVLHGFLEMNTVWQQTFGVLVLNLPFAKEGLQWLIPVGVMILLAIVLPNRSKAATFELSKWQ